jgi:vancomycin resistance protein YoaR
MYSKLEGVRSETLAGDAMPFDPEFKQHLHSLMVEVAEKTSDECVRHKNELVGKAIATHNSAAPPIAYKDAALYSMEFRLSKTIEKYIEAVAIWGYSIDAAFERDMVNEFWSLTAGPNQLQFPPAIRGHQVQGVQGAYSRERAQLASRLVREGTNRLKELKMKTKQARRATESATHNIFNAPVGNAFINSSVVQTTNNITLTTQILDDIDRLSEGHHALQSAAIEVRNSKSANVVDKLQKWAGLANAVAGLSEKIHQHFPQIAAMIEHLKNVRV